MTSVKDQSICGSCWAFSAVAALESATLIANKTPNMELDLSEQVLVSCCNATCSPQGDCNGGFPEYAADFLRDQGAPLESCLSYTGIAMCANACPNWQASAYRAKSWEWVVNYVQNEAPTVDAIKAGLQKQPLAITMAVYSDFMTYSSGVYKHVSGGLAGYHAILVVGYDDAGQYFTAKNSWGPAWGEQGYFRIAYSEVTGASQFGYMTQAYYVGDNPNPNPTCEYALADYYTASGGTGTVQMVNPGAESRAYWITVTGTDSKDPRIVTYAVAPNATGAPRDGILTGTGGAAVVAGNGLLNYAIFQEAGSPQCTYSISPASNSFDINGGTGNVTVTAPAGCPWVVANTSADWITITSGKTGSGNGTVTYSVAPNGSYPRNPATIKIADQNFTVNQAGCTYASSPFTQRFGPEGGTGTINVTATPGCAWTASGSQNWFTITSGWSGVGNGTITYTVAPNVDSTDRTLYCSVPGFFVLYQGGMLCDYSYTPTSQDFGSGGGTGTVNITVGRDCQQPVVSSGASWIKIISGPAGTGKATLTYAVAANSGASRTAAIWTNATPIIVTQAGGSTCTYSIAPTSQSVSAAGAMGTVSVTAPSGCAWSATSTVPWIAVTSGATGSGNGTVSFSFMANISTSRMGTLIVAGQNFTLTQAAGSSCTYSITPASQSVSAAGSTGTVSVTAPSGCAWAATSNISWISVTSGASGSGNGTAGYSVAKNTEGTSRTGTVTIAGTPFTVTQAGQNCAYAVTPASQNFSASGGTGTMSVSAPSDCAWMITGLDQYRWITVTSPKGGSGNGTVSYTVAPNAGASRTGSIAAGDTVTSSTPLSINQAAGGACACSVTPNPQNVSAAGGKITASVSSGSGCSWTSSSDASWITITSGSGSGNGTVNYSTTPNYVMTPRTGHIWIADTILTVTQAASTCSWGLDLYSRSFAATGGTGSFGVYVYGSGCAWTAASSVSWITITSGSGSANGTVSYSVAANTDVASRTGAISIAGTTFTVTQAGGGSTCTYAITPTQSFTAAAGTGTASITAPSGCAWQAISNNTSWLTVTSGANGSGNGKVSYAVTANTYTTPRAGTLTIAGQTFSIIQAGGGGTCSYTLSPASNSFTAAAGTGSVSVSAGSGCAWNATSNNTSWLTVSSGSSGTGNGTVGYAVTANTSSTQRSATLTIAGQTFNVSQAAQSCTYAISPTGNSFTSAAGTGMVNVTAGSGCTWTATSNATTFLTVTSGASGSGNGTVNYAVTANTTTAQRNGTLTVAGQTFTATQAAQACTYSISPTSNSFTAAAGTGSVSVASASGCAWTATSNASWILVNYGPSGSGNGTVGYLVAANTTTSSRTGTLTIAGQTFTVTQTGQSCTYSISPTSKSFTAVAGTGSVSVTAPTGCAWQAVSNNTAWLSVTGSSSGSGNGSVSYSVTANNTTTSRTGTLTIAGQTHTVTQAGLSCTYSISPTSKSFTSAAGTGSVSVSSASGCTWTATSAATSWLTISSGSSGSGNGTVNYSVTANTFTTSRTGTLTIAGQTHTVTQAWGTTCTYSISPVSNSFTAAAGTGTVTVTTPTTCTWTAASNATWISITSKASGYVSYSVVANTTTTSRTGSLTIAGQTHTVTQAAGGSCMYSISPTSNSLSAAAGTGTVTVSSSPSLCSWTAMSNAPSWLTVTSGATGWGNGTVGYSVTANTTTSSRTGSLTIGGQSFTVTQAGATPACKAYVSPVDYTVDASGLMRYIGVGADSTCKWTVTSNATWIIAGGSGQGNGTFLLMVQGNSGPARTGTLSVNGTVVTITEKGAAK